MQCALAIGISPRSSVGKASYDKLARTRALVFVPDPPVRHVNSLFQLRLRREAVAEDVFGNAAGDQKVAEVIGSAGLGAAAGEFETAEGLAADEGAGDSAIDVKIADAEFAAGAGDVGGASGEYSTG